MFVVIYSFKIKLEEKAVFFKVWREMTMAIRENCGGLGSRLHQKSDSEYIAYAQWPDENTFNNALFPKQFEELKSKLKNTTKSISILHKLKMIDDLLI